jgi:pyridoxal phosphate enzyme (YggS family)
MSIAENLSLINNKIADAAKKSGRERKDVRLIAVSKTFSEEYILKAYAAGQRLFAENYVQEFLVKNEKLKHLDIEWHFIGHLQTNKVKQLRAVSLIHSIDRESLVKEIDNRSTQAQNVLIEINLAQESSKTGAHPESVPSLIDAIQKSKNITLCGVMLMPPIDITPAQSKSYFMELQKLAAAWTKRLSPPHTLHEFSMGTSRDYEVAIECGATMIRLGTSIFGSRTA